MLADLLPRRVGRAGLVRAPVGHDDRDLDRLHRRGRLLPDDPDHADGARLVLHPRRRLPGRRRPLPGHPRRLRRRRRDERLPAGEHRHFVIAAHVRRADPRLDVLRRPRRDGRAEDLLHGDRRRSSTSTSSSRCRARTTSSSAASPIAGCSSPRSSSAASSLVVSRRREVLDARSRASGSRRSRAARSWRSRATTSSRCCCRRSARGSRSSCVIADLPRRLQHPGHVPHDHVGRRRQLAREHRLVHAGRRRHHAGGQQRLALERDDAGDRGRLLARPADHHHRLELRLRDRARHLGVRLDRWQEARRASRTPEPRRRRPSSRPPTRRARRRRRRRGASGRGAPRKHGTPA